VRVQQQLVKEMKPVAALKQHYERYHAEDLAALKELYEYHAENCVRAAELTDDPRRCEEYLKLARAWTEAAITIRELMARRFNQPKPADDAPSLTSRTRKRMATRNPRKRRKPLDLLRSQETYEDLEKLREARARQ
jgi:hypothetical protein